jgi:uncharacterized protein with ATP-grasp and redox domains
MIFKVFAAGFLCKEILYICDDAGESLFDKLFMEFWCISIRINITAAMRHTPIINDATSRMSGIGLDTVAELYQG